MKLTNMLCPLTLAVAFGCASTGPTPELIDARRAYDEARQSEAATYSPDKLLTAKQALERAEAAHGDDPGSFEERSLAYVAQRKSQFASVYGMYEKDRRDQAEAEQAYKNKQDTLRRNAEKQATEAQKSLAATWDNLSCSQGDRGSADADPKEQGRARRREGSARQGRAERSRRHGQPVQDRSGQGRAARYRDHARRTGFVRHR
jgi:hypothetical protein